MHGDQRQPVRAPASLGTDGRPDDLRSAGDRPRASSRSSIARRRPIRRDPIASPYKLQAEPARKWKNLQGIPIGWITSEFGAGGSPVANVAFLKQVGCSVEMLRLRDYGIFGNGNLMLMEKNNHEVFGVLRDWLDRKVAPPA